MTLIWVLYTSGLVLMGNEPPMIIVREFWPPKSEMMNHGMMNYFLKFGKKNLYHKAIEEFMGNGNENPWILRWNEISRNYSEILLNLPQQPIVD